MRGLKNSRDKRKAENQDAGSASPAAKRQKNPATDWKEVCGFVGNRANTNPFIQAHRGYLLLLLEHNKLLLTQQSLDTIQTKSSRLNDPDPLSIYNSIAKPERGNLTNLGAITVAYSACLPSIYTASAASAASAIPSSPPPSYAETLCNTVTVELKAMGIDLDSLQYQTASEQFKNTFKSLPNVITDHAKLQKARNLLSNYKLMLLINTPSEMITLLNLIPPGSEELSDYQEILKLYELCEHNRTQLTQAHISTSNKAHPVGFFG